MSKLDINEWTKWERGDEDALHWVPDPAQKLRSEFEKSIWLDDFETKEGLFEEFLTKLENMVRDAAIGDRGMQSTEANLLQDIFL